MNRFSQLVTTALIVLSSAASAAPAPHWVASWQARSYCSFALRVVLMANVDRRGADRYTSGQRT
ncbi:MAG: hypothetical protein E6861_22220, partial [Stenotrophomonas maltophilia]|nr:hypothetical protein [Stenotrophomonas maltophilia]